MTEDSGWLAPVWNLDIWMGQLSVGRHWRCQLDSPGSFQSRGGSWVVPAPGCWWGALHRRVAVIVIGPDRDELRVGSSDGRRSG